MILGALLSKNGIADGGNTNRSLLAAVVGGLVSCVQLGIYNLSGWTPTGDSKGEQAAHYLEFSFGIISALITFHHVRKPQTSTKRALRNTSEHFAFL